MIIGMVRYSIPNVFGDTENSRNLIQLYEEPYFSTRLNIFKNITLKSFAQQTNKNFILLVYHTSMIPDNKRKIFDNIEKEYTFVKNVYINNIEMNIPEEFKDERICTFRIDNDDGIAIDFIEKLQKAKDIYKDDIVISISHANKICRISENDYRIAAFNNVSNSMGLAYLSSDNKTIMNLGQHQLIPERFKIKVLNGNGGLQVINNYNVANSFKSKSKLKTFTLDYQNMKKYLIKENYGNLDISCLPILCEK